MTDNRAIYHEGWRRYCNYINYECFGLVSGPSGQLTCTSIYTTGKNMDSIKFIITVEFEKWNKWIFVSLINSEYSDVNSSELSMTRLLCTWNTTVVVRLEIWWITNNWMKSVTYAYYSVRLFLCRNVTNLYGNFQS